MIKRNTESPKSSNKHSYISYISRKQLRNKQQMNQTMHYARVTINELREAIKTQLQAQYNTSSPMLKTEIRLYYQ